MHLVVLVAFFHKELVLHPVSKFQETRINKFFYVLHVFLGDTHTTQLHAAVCHLVNHVDIQKVALCQFVCLLLATVPEGNGRFWKVALQRE